MNAKPNIVTPSMKEAERMLDMLDGGGEFTFQTFDDAGKSKNLAHICHGSLEANFETLARLNSQGAGVFVTVNQTDLRGRTGSNITRVRALWVDFDKVNHERVQRLQNMSLAPNLIVESSAGKHHAYWIIDSNSGVIPLEQFTELQKRLIHHFADDGADKAVHDLPRVMRLAGFYHCKGEPFMTHVVHADAWYEVQELVTWVQSLPMPKATTKPKAQAATKTHTEYNTAHELDFTLDFKQTKSLARGRWEEILNRIGCPVATSSPKEHGSCPACGGADRFRFDNEHGDGSFICSQGTGEPIAGDGFTLLEHAGYSKIDALKAVNRALVGMGLINEHDNSKTVHEWGEPKPLHIPSQYAECEYPIHAFPDIVRNAIKKAAMFTRTPLALSGQTFLGTMVYVAQEHADAHSDFSSYGQPCSFGLLSIFESGGGKDLLKNIAAKVIDEVEENSIKAWKAEIEAWNALPKPEKSVTTISRNPQTIFKKGSTQGITQTMARSSKTSFTWQTTEGAQVFGGYSFTSDTMGESLGVINSLVDKGSSSSNMKGDGDPEFVQDKRFCIDVTIQDVMINKVLNDDVFRLQGILARFLFAAPEPLPFREITKHDRNAIADNDADIRAYYDLCERLKNPIEKFNPDKSSPPIGRTIFAKNAAADDIHIQYENYIKRNVQDGEKYNFIRPYALRTVQIALRVATVLAYFTPSMTHIDAQTMQNAIDLCKYSLDEWLRYYGKVEKSDSEKMLEWLKKQNSTKILKSSISLYAYPKHLRTKSNRDAALNHLIDAEHIHIENIERKEYVVLNPITRKSG